jgi:hypothetical protein
MLYSTLLVPYFSSLCRGRQSEQVLLLKVRKTNRTWGVHPFGVLKACLDDFLEQRETVLELPLGTFETIRTSRELLRQSEFAPGVAPLFQVDTEKITV